MLPNNPLAQRFLERHPGAAAEVLAVMPPWQLAEVLADLDIATLAQLASRLPGQTISHCLKYLSLDQSTALLSCMPLRNAMDILRRIAAAERERYLAALPMRTAATVRAGLERVQEHVAAHVDSRVQAFPLDLTVEQVLLALGRGADEYVCHVYVIDGHTRFAGVLPMRALLASHTHLRLGSLPVQPIAALPEAARISNVLGHPDWRRFHQLPVVDAAGCFVGVLRREHLVERGAAPRQVAGGVLGMGLALIEGYAMASAVLLELLMQGGGRRR